MATGDLLIVLLTMSIVRSSVVTLGEQSSFCITPSGEASAPLRSGRVPKNTREFGSPMATCKRRCLRPCSDCSIRSMTLSSSFCGQGSLREAISTGPSGVTAISLTADLVLAQVEADEPAHRDFGEQGFHGVAIRLPHRHAADKESRGRRPRSSAARCVSLNHPLACPRGGR